MYDNTVEVLDTLNDGLIESRKLYKRALEKATGKKERLVLKSKIEAIEEIIIWFCNTQREFLP